MKLSTKGRYGVRLMIDLAIHYGEGPVLLREIAKREEISEKYLSNLVNPLKARGLVEATRGVHGGYVLGKEACRDHDERDRRGLGRIALSCGLCRKTCRLRPCGVLRRPRSLERGGAGYGRILGKYTLADMVRRQKAKRENVTTDNYTI